jgi:uncharacterized protein (UPF0276 family)
MESLPKLGVGLAYQAPLRSVIDRAGEDIDFVEVVPDIVWTDLGPGECPRYIDEKPELIYFRKLAHSRRVVPHSIGLSIGSAHEFNREHVRQMRRWWDRLHFPWHSDHLAYHLAENDGRQVNVGITLPLPRERETVDLLVPRIDEVLRRVPAPFLLENNVYYFDIADCEMDEATFLNTICKESGCGLLLDLHNLYVNCRNHGYDVQALVSRLDLEHVGEIHVAGGMVLDGFYLDAHSGPVPEPVWRLLEWTLPRSPNVGGVVFELFGSWFDTLGEARLRRDLRRMKEIWRQSFGDVKVSATGERGGAA